MVLAASLILGAVVMPATPSGAAGICRPWQQVVVPDLPGVWLTGVSGTGP